MVQSVYRGNSITLSARYEDGAGNLTDPLNPLITIRDPLGAAIVTAATPTRISLGNYQYVYPVSSLAATGWWTIDWTGTVSGQGLGPLSENFQVLAVGSITPTFNGSYTYDIGTDTGRIRLLIDDRDFTLVDAQLPYEKRSAIFTDEEVGAFLSQMGNDIYYAAALALRTIAINRSLLIQSRKVGQTEVSFGAARADLMKAASDLVAQSNQLPAEGYAEHVWDDFTLRRVITNAALRENV